MNGKDLGILRFHEQYFERIWGGQRLRALYGKAIPEDKPIGEAWLISDHPTAVSVVSEGPLAGKTLHELIEEHPEPLLGSRAKLTPHGRFPLLLKVLDSTDVLSVQVHPDDAMAETLGEPDVGKTEMWYVLHADPDAELFCGLTEETTPEAMSTAIKQGRLEQHLRRFNVKRGDSVFVEAGTVHAIGAGIVLAEIQQNSDLTYRLYDWNRVDASGKGRELHLERGLRATKYPGEVVLNKKYESWMSGTESGSQLVSSNHFCAYHMQLSGVSSVTTNGNFYIVLSIDGSIAVSSETGDAVLGTGQCCFVSACIDNFTLRGPGEALLYTA